MAYVPSRAEDRAVAETVRREVARLGLPRSSGLADVIVEHRALAAAALLIAQRAHRTTPIRHGELDVYGDT